VVRALRERGHEVRGFDREPARMPGAHELGDLLDVEALAHAVAGMETVVHCAAVPERQDFASELVPANIVGTHLLFEAARLARVQRVIYVSSVRVVGGLDWEKGRIGLAAGFVPGDHYGVSKATASFWLACTRSVSASPFSSARLGWFVRNGEEARLFESVRSAPRIYLSHRDAETFFIHAVEASLPPYAAVFVTSKNDGDSAFDLEPARAVLGFEPEHSWPSGSNWSEELRFDSPRLGASLRPEVG
jgi:nucleoside-diphosphate-sugar epimerase